MMLLLVAMLTVGSLADPTLTVDSSFGLAINVAGIPTGKACTITWERSDGIGPRVSQHFPAESVIRLLRFTPKKEYKFQVKDESGNTVGSKMEYTCIAGETGVQQYDADAPFVKFSGRPSFDLLVVDHNSALVGFNSQGWIVWYLPQANGAWDQLPADMDYDIVTLAGRSSLEASGLQELTPTGDYVKNVSFSGLSHEARVDSLTHGVLSVGSEVRNITGLKNPIQGSTIVHWNMTTGAVETLYNLFDFYNPVTDYGACSGRNDSTACALPSMDKAYSGGSLSSLFPPSGEDWTHANSVERGTQNNYIMSVRHLSSVISFHADGSGIQWVLSGEGVVPSKDPKAVVLKYARDGEQQYMEHCARQLSNGNIILFDNGDLRTPPFTRFSEYEIDPEKGTAKLVWQFAPMLNNATSGLKSFAFHAGSVHRLANGNTVGALSCDNARVGTNCTHAIFEANSAGEEVARTLVPQPAAGGDWGYRGLPLHTLGGERQVGIVDTEFLV